MVLSYTQLIRQEKIKNEYKMKEDSTERSTETSVQNPNEEIKE